MASYCPPTTLGLMPSVPAQEGLYQSILGSGEVDSTARRCQVHRRRAVKRKCRPEEEDEGLHECFTSKRFLSEESMASRLQQLNIATGTPPVRTPQLNIATGTPPVRTPQLNIATGTPPVRTPQLNIRTVASCHTSMNQTDTAKDPILMRGSSPADYTNIDPRRNSIGPSVSQVADNLEPCREISSVMVPTSLLSGSSDGVQLKKKQLLSHHLTRVQIEVTPATPTDNSAPMKLHQEDSGDAMAITPSLEHRCCAMNTLRKDKNWDVIIEDLSSDSSDGLESPEGPVSVWLAPELQRFNSCKKDHLLPAFILDEINKKGMELVPWVDPDALLRTKVVPDQEEEASETQWEYEDEDLTMEG